MTSVMANVMIYATTNVMMNVTTQLMMNVMMNVIVDRHAHGPPFILTPRNDKTSHKSPRFHYIYRMAITIYMIYTIFDIIFFIFSLHIPIRPPCG